MTQDDPRKHHRRSIRLRGWDYRAPAYYFVTICTHQRQCFFDEPSLADIAAQTLLNLPHQPHAQHVALDEWVVMPNHVHAILVFTDFPAHADLSKKQEGFRNALAGSLGVVVGQYKSQVTRVVNGKGGVGGKLWQRGYYERIIRDEREWRATQTYIRNNPARWAEDRENLDGLLSKMTRRGG